MIETVVVKYSKDGVLYQCYDSCKEVKLIDGYCNLEKTVYGNKLRVYPAKWTGEPSCTIAFNYHNWS